MIAKIILIILFIALLGGIYWFFRSSRSFVVNRVLLLCIPLLAVLFSFVRLPYKQMDTIAMTTYAKKIPLLPVIIENVIAPEDLSTLKPNKKSPFREKMEFMTKISLIIYLIGVGIMLLLFLIKINVLYKNHKNGIQKGALIFLKNSNDAYTFLRNIYIGDRITPSQQNAILKHEQVHQQQWHSLDLLYYELLKIIFWFHPVVYFLQRELGATHEYIADQIAIKDLDKTTYYNTLINSFFESENIPFVNSFFNQSLLKRRITMLNALGNNKSKKRYLLLLPAFLFFTTISAYVSYTNDPIILDLRTTGHNSFMKVEGCNVRGDYKFHCIETPIIQHIEESLEPNTFKEIKAKGPQMIAVSFTIKEDNSITHISTFASIPELAVLAKKGVEQLPKMYAPVKEGKPVRRRLKFRIIFNLNEDKNSLEYKIKEERKRNKK